MLTRDGGRIPASDRMALHRGERTLGQPIGSARVRIRALAEAGGGRRARTGSSISSRRRSRRSAGAITRPCGASGARARRGRVDRGPSLPAGVFYGTSTWSFPGWAGIVYSRRTTTAELAREGLAEYARHPLLTTVGIDRGYYGPIPKGGSRALRRAASAGLSVLRQGARSGDRRSSVGGSRAERRLPATRGRFIEEMVEPFLEVFREHTGPFVVQLPPAPRRETTSTARSSPRSSTASSARCLGRPATPSSCAIRRF